MRKIHAPLFGPVALAAFAAFALSACGSDFGVGVKHVDPAVAARPDPAEVAAKPCVFGDVVGCVAQCTAGTASSCNSLGVLFEYGAKSSVDPATASSFYARACDAEYAPGCTNLAWLYSLGRGVPRDARQAMVLFTRAFDSARLACLRGDSQGCMMAGELILQGQVAGDDAEELAMFRTACDAGVRQGCDYVETLR